MNITEKYLFKILSQCAAIGRGEVREKKGGHEIPCPFCCLLQDKERKIKKRVGMFFPDNKYSYNYNCVRCGEKMDFDNFLETFDTKLFNKYQMERFHAGTTGKGHTLRDPTFNIKKPKFEQ